MDEQLRDLLDWAFDESLGEPVQDWDLLVAAGPYANTCLRLAADPDCPKAGFFLTVLYLVVGDAVRTNYITRTRPEVEKLLERGRRELALEAWVARSVRLMERPETFHYEDWCGGRLAGSRA